MLFHSKCFECKLTLISFMAFVLGALVCITYSIRLKYAIDNTRSECEISIVRIECHTHTCTVHAVYTVPYVVACVLVLFGCTD